MSNNGIRTLDRTACNLVVVQSPCSTLFAVPTRASLGENCGLPVKKQLTRYLDLATSKYI